MTYKATVLALSPVHYWTLDETAGATAAVDYGSDARNLSVVGTVTFGSASLLVGDASTRLAVTRHASPTSDNGLITGNVPSSVNFGTGDFTVAWWFKSTLTDLQVTVSIDGDWIGVDGAGKVNLLGGNTASTNVSDGNAHFIVLMRRSGSIRIYVDGVLDNTPASSSLTIGGTNKTVSVAYFSAAAGFGVTGGMQHVALWNSGLSDGNVSTLYTAGSTVPAMEYVQNLGDAVAASASSATVTSRAPTLGSGSYTYAWYLGSTPGFTPGVGTLASGQTSQTATFSGLTANVDYWAVCVVGDGSTTATSFRRLIRLSGLAALRVLCIGDSTTHPGDPATQINGEDGSWPRHFQTYLETEANDRKVTVLNRGLSGTATTDWISGSTNMNAALAAAVSAGFTSGDWAVVRLGTNDAQAAVSASDYNTALTSCVGALTGAGYYVQIDYPTYREPGPFYEDLGGTVFTDDYAAAIWDYYPVIDALANGTTIRVGDKVTAKTSASMPALSLNRSTTYPGAIHPSVDGAIAMGVNSAEAMLRNAATGGTAVGFPSSSRLGGVLQT